MSGIVKGEPEGRRYRSRTEAGVLFQELGEIAKADPGEWYSVEIPDGVSANNATANLRGQVAKVAADYSIRDGRAWVRFKI